MRQTKLYSRPVVLMFWLSSQRKWMEKKQVALSERVYLIECRYALITCTSKRRQCLHWWKKSSKWSLQRRAINMAIIRIHYDPLIRHTVLCLHSTKLVEVRWATRKWPFKDTKCLAQLSERLNKVCFFWRECLSRSNVRMQLIDTQSR